MARVNVYLPDDLAEAARSAGLNISGVTQAALTEALAADDLDRWLDGVAGLTPVEIDRESVLEAVRGAKADLGDEP